MATRRTFGSQKRKQKKGAAPAVMSAMMRLEGLRAIAASLAQVSLALAAVQTLENDEARGARIDALLVDVRTALHDLNRELANSELPRSNIAIVLRSRPAPEDEPPAEED